ncbi:MAG: inositol monophosphatase [bacterium]|nr:inositol monophosphatase [bacterium]
MDKAWIDGALKVVFETLNSIRPELTAAHGNIKSKEKDDNTIVTELDRKIEELLHTNLMAYDATIGFKGEEKGHRHEDQKETFWLVDPIDGTEHFVRGALYCSSMVALIHKGEPIASVIDCFAANQRFVAIKGEGATLNGKPIQVSKTKKLKRSLIEIETNTAKKANLEIWKNVRNEIFGYTNFVAAGWGYSRVAMGEIDARITKDGWGQDHDYAVGALLVSEAGGKVANIGSKTYDYKNLNFVASAPGIFGDLQKLLTA